MTTTTTFADDVKLVLEALDLRDVTMAVFLWAGPSPCAIWVDISGNGSRRWLFSEPPLLVSPLADWFHSLGMEASPHATAMCLMELRDADCREDMSKIKVPTGIFHGRQDKICSFDLADAMHQGIPGSHIIPFERSGHGLVVDETRKFNQELIDFVG